MTDWEVVTGDCRSVLSDQPENKFDSVVTDPPYGLNFMGKDWDHGVPGNVFWEAVLRACKPGAHLLAFGGTRTFHRLTCAIEDAGWEIRDCVMWVYGSGFPKSLDVSKAIDKAAGAERPVTHTTESGGYKRLMVHNAEDGFRPEDYYPEGNKFRSNDPITDLARQWSGWGTALKPAHEPIVVARKPLIGTVVRNVTQYGTGAINVGDCRVGTEGGGTSCTNRDENGKCLGHNNAGRSTSGETFHGPDTSGIGRWPANLIHDGSDEVLAAFPDAKGQQGDLVGHANARKSPNGCFGEMAPANDHHARRDSGSAARFFYCAKANKKDRGEGNNHPTVKPTDLMRYLCRLVTPPGGIVLDPFCGSGSTGKAAVLEGFKFFGIDTEQSYTDIARSRLSNLAEVG